MCERIITISRYNGKKWKVVSKKEKYICPYCESRNVYRVKKKQVIYCRICGKSSSMEGKK